MSRMQKRFLDCTDMSLAEAESFGQELCTLQRDIMWWIGDLARYAEKRWPETWHQVFPEWVSPGLIQRCAGVCRAYPRPEDRQHEATYTQYMQVASRPDRQSRLAKMVSDGQTTDESRRALQAERKTPARRYLLAFDVHYFAHRAFFSGAATETAHTVRDWIKRTVERLKAKGATDVLCAFEGTGSFRRELTSGPEWEGQRYKDRPAKPHDLVHQLHLLRDLLEQEGFACVSVDGYEADDVLASAAKQFDGQVTLISADKDLRQCLVPGRCNILLDVVWTEDPTSGEMIPEYQWLTAQSHTEATGIPPEQWPDFQAIMGDASDTIKGAAGIGEKGAADLIRMFGSAQAAIEAAKAEDDRINPKKRAALVEFESRLETTLRLVRLVDSLPIPQTTRI